MKKLHLKHVAAALALFLPLLAFSAERQIVDIAVKGMTCPARSAPTGWRKASARRAMSIMSAPA